MQSLVWPVEGAVVPPTAFNPGGGQGTASPEITYAARRCRVVADRFAM